jgi:hypothetical protein
MVYLSWFIAVVALDERVSLRAAGFLGWVCVAGSTRIQLLPASNLLPRLGSLSQILKIMFLYHPLLVVLYHKTP